MQPLGSVKPTLYRHPHGITAVDAEYLYPGHAAAHLIADGGRAAFVDVGTNSSVAYLLAALDELGIARAAVDYLLLTHVHLDHAGGAGTLMRELPNARALLHPRGVPHMIDPRKLIAGSQAVYGEEHFRRMYGELLPIAPGRVRAVADGERIVLGGRALELIHTPGHAQHHYVVVDSAHASIFSGDTFGISYRALDTDRGAFGDFQRSSQHLAIGGVAWDDQRVGLQSELGVRRCGRRVGRASTSGMPSRHSGRALRRELQVRMRHWRAACRSQLARAGSGRPVGWHRSVWLRSRDDICRSVSVRSWRC